MKLMLLLVMFLFLGQLDVNGQKMEFRTGDKNFGWHFIIWTTDTTKCSPKKIPPLSFDQNNVVYLHTSFANKYGVRILNEKGGDISGQMREIMGSAHTLRFYRPTKKEIKKHPTFDEYYMNLSDQAITIYLNLEKKGYTTRDPKIE